MERNDSLRLKKQLVHGNPNIKEKQSQGMNQLPGSVFWNG